MTPNRSKDDKWSSVRFEGVQKLNGTCYGLLVWMVQWFVSRLLLCWSDISILPCMEIPIGVKETTSYDKRLTTVNKWYLGLDVISKISRTKKVKVCVAAKTDAPYISTVSATVAITTSALFTSQIDEACHWVVVATFRLLQEFWIYTFSFFATNWRHAVRHRAAKEDASKASYFFFFTRSRPTAKWRRRRWQRRLLTDWQKRQTCRQYRKEQ